MLSHWFCFRWGMMLRFIFENKREFNFLCNLNSNFNCTLSCIMCLLRWLATWKNSLHACCVISVSLATPIPRHEKQTCFQVRLRIFLIKNKSIALLVILCLYSMKAFCVGSQSCFITLVFNGVFQPYLNLVQFLLLKQVVSTLFVETILSYKFG